METSSNYTEKRSNTFAILGIIFAFLMPVLGIIFSVIGMSKAKELDGEGSGLAKAGLAISIVVVAIEVIAFLAMMSLLGGAITNIDTNFNTKF